VFGAARLKQWLGNKAMYARLFIQLALVIDCEGDVTAEFKRLVEKSIYSQELVLEALVQLVPKRQAPPWAREFLVEIVNELELRVRWARKIIRRIARGATEEDARKVARTIIEKELATREARLSDQALHLLANICQAWPACKPDVRQKLDREQYSRSRKWTDEIFH
jgi:hypothetical protein